MKTIQVDFDSLERQRSAARVKAEIEEKRAIAKREEQLTKALKEFKGSTNNVTNKNNKFKQFH